MRTGKKLLTGMLLVLFIVFVAGCGKAKKTGAVLPEVRNSGTAIQWRYPAEEEWRDLVALTELRGASVCSVLAVFSGSTSQLGKRHKVAPFFFGGVSPLDCRAAVAYLRQCGVGFYRFAASGSKYNAKYGAKCNDNATASFLQFSLPPFVCG